MTRTVPSLVLAAAVSVFGTACGSDPSVTPDGGRVGVDAGPRDLGAMSDAPVGPVDAAGRDAGPPVDAGPSDVGDRYLATDGADTGDCSVNACATLAYVAAQMAAGETVVVRDGTYPDGIGATLLPRGSAAAPTRVVSAHDGAATFTGPLSLYEDGATFYLEFVGLRFEGPDTKAIAGSNVTFRRVSFAGGPTSGNAASVAIGTNDFYPGARDILLEDCLFYGLGGRYALLAYRTQNVVVRRAVLRKDGGWGLGGPSATEFEPEGVLNFYESLNGLCDHCVVFDSLKLSDDSAEALGGFLSVSNGAPDSVGTLFTASVAVNNEYKGFAFEGGSSVTGARVEDSYAIANTYGIVANVVRTSDLTLERVAVIGNGGAGVASYGVETVSLLDSIVRGNTGPDLDGVSGSTTGAGPSPLDLSGFNSARIRAEFCRSATRGLCAGGTSFQEYLTGYLSR